MAVFQLRVKNTVDLSGFRKNMLMKVQRGIEITTEQAHEIAVNRAPVSSRTDNKGERGSFSQEKSGIRRTKGPADVPVTPFRVGSTRFERGTIKEVVARLDTGDSTDDFEFRVSSGRRKGETVPNESVIRKGEKLFSFGGHRPGTLRDSIKSRVTVEQGRVVGTVYTDIPYAKPVEYGFHHKGGSKHEGSGTNVAAQPFMRPALLEVREDFRSGKSFKG